MLYLSGTVMIYYNGTVIVSSKGAKVIYFAGAIKPSLLTMMMIYCKKGLCGTSIAFVRIDPCSGG